MCSAHCVGIIFLGVLLTGAFLLAAVIFTCCSRFERLPVGRECERVSTTTCPSVEILGRLRDLHIHADMGVTCAICLETLMVGDVAKELHCQHIFHSDCLKSWCSHQLRDLDTSFRCPLCRELQSEGRIEEGAVVVTSL